MCVDVTPETGRVKGNSMPRSAVERSLLRNAWITFWYSKPAAIGGVVATLLILIVVLAPYLAPYDPHEMLADGLSEIGSPVPPNAQFLLGTDRLGRDMLSRLLWGGRISLGIGICSNLLAVAIAVIAGSLAGYLGGVVDTVIMRFIDLIMAFPVLLLSVGLVAVLRPSPLTIILVIAFVNWTYLGRIIYHMVRAITQRGFILAAHSVGVPEVRILIRHILPQLTSIIVVYASLGISTSVMLESTLSYIGIGVQPPIPSWGNMINEGQRFYRTAPWMVLYPGALIALTVMSFNLMGDRLRDLLDPYTSRKL